MTTVFAPFGTAAEPFYSVKLSYLTDILTAEDGTEQRVMLRIIPKREHAFLARTYRTYRTAWLDSLTYGNQSSQLAVPEWPHGTFLTSAVTAGSARVFNVLTTADTDFAVGGTAIAWNDEGHTEELTITAKSATSITATTAYNWGTGTFVIPSHRGKYQGDLPIARLSASIADLPVTVTMEHGADPAVTSPTVAEIFDIVPYMRDVVSHDLTRAVVRLESPTYTYADYPTGSSPIGRRPFKVWLASRASVTALIAWFHGLRGRYKTFYLPTYQQDLDVLSGLGTTTLTITRSGYTSNLFPMASRKVFAAVEPNGTVTKCTVLDATDNGVATNTENLTFDTTVPAGTTLLSYLLYGRLESDTLELRWRTNGFADCEMGFVECPAELAPTEFEALPDANNGGTPNAVAGPAVASMTTAVVPNGQDEVTTYFTVTARDAAGIRLTTGGATVAASVTGANTATPTITDLSNGQYRARYTPHNLGSDSVAITYNASPIRNSPYTSLVGATPVIVPTAIPFGFSYFSVTDLSYIPGITEAFRGVTSGSILGHLAACQAAGVKLVFGWPRAEVKDSAGRFSLSRFMAYTDTVAALPGMAAYIADGTLGMHRILDDIDAKHWGGIKPSLADLSAACAYSKSVWSTVPTMVRLVATSLVGMTDMDYCMCGYRTIRGDVTAWRTANERAAETIGCSIMFGLNLLNGGDGSSNIRGTSEDGQSGEWWCMSATEITTYGRILLASPKCKWFNCWRYHNNDQFVSYYATPGIETALTDLASFCAAEVR